jgi:hypothetical protein
MTRHSLPSRRWKIAGALGCLAWVGCASGHSSHAAPPDAGATPPPDAGTYPYYPGPSGGDGAPNWQLAERPTVDGYHPRHGLSTSDENGVQYPPRIKVGSSTNPVALTFGGPSVGWVLTDSHGANVSFPTGTMLLDQDGYWRVQNLEVVGYVDVDGPLGSTIDAWTTIDATPRNVNLAVGSSLVWDAAQDSGRIIIGAIPCHFTGVASSGSSSWLTGVTSLDGISHAIKAQASVEQALWLGRMRNVKVTHRLADGFSQLQVLTMNPLYIPQGFGRGQLGVGLVAGTATTVVNVQGIRNDANQLIVGTGIVAFSPTGGQALVGHDLISYSSTTDHGGGIGTLNGVKKADGSAYVPNQSWLVNGCQITQTSGADSTGRPYAFTLPLQSIPSNFPNGPGVISLLGIIELHYEGIDRTHAQLTGVSAVTPFGGGITYASGAPVRTEISAMVLKTEDTYAAGFRASGAKLDVRDLWMLYPYDSKGSAAAILAASMESSITNHILDGFLDDGIRGDMSLYNMHFANGYWGGHPGRVAANPQNHIDGAQSLSGFNRDGIAFGTLIYDHGHTGNSAFFTNASSTKPAHEDYQLFMANTMFASPAKVAFVGQSATGCGARDSYVDRSTLSVVFNESPLRFDDNVTTTSVASTDTSITLSSTNYSVTQFNSDWPVPAPIASALPSPQTLQEAGSVTLSNGLGAALASTNGTVALVDGSNKIIFDFDTRSGDTLQTIRIRWSAGSLGYTANARLITQVGSLSDDTRSVAVPFSYTGTVASSKQVTGVFGLSALAQTLPAGTRVSPVPYISTSVVHSNLKWDDGVTLLSNSTP